MQKVEMKCNIYKHWLNKLQQSKKTSHCFWYFLIKLFLLVYRPGLTGNVATGLLTMIPFGLLNDSGTNSTLNEIKIYLHQLLFFAMRNPFPSIAKSLNL